MTSLFKLLASMAIVLTLFACSSARFDTSPDACFDDFVQAAMHTATREQALAVLQFGTMICYKGKPHNAYR